ncbi:MAG: amidohydrolase [Mycobacterium sp.]|nr:amidohydrolase [Mycobacterium sp.]
MKFDDMVLISIDDHVIEPPDMFKNHVPTRWADRAPRVVHNENGTDQWIFEGGPLGAPMALNAVASWPHDEYGWDPVGYAELRPGTYDIHERVRDMNRNGVFQSMCFASMIGFSGRIFLDPPDKDISLVMLKAYNDWHVDEWCGTYPGRFIPLGNMPLWDANLAADEVHRLAAKGCRSVSFPEAPHVLGLPSFHTDYWDPMFKAMSDEGTVLNLHIGISQQAISLAKEVPVDHPTFIGPMVCGMLTATDLIWGPTLRKFPDLKIALSEGGVGWLQFFFERVDRHHRIQTWTKQDFGGKLPSEVLREHILACFISDPAGLRQRREIGIDRLAWECDYPHSDGSWPNSPEELWAEFKDTGCTDEEIDKITHQNVSRFYDFDPFDLISKENATVKALRALSPDVDVAETSREEYRRRSELAAH